MFKQFDDLDPSTKLLFRPFSSSAAFSLYSTLLAAAVSPPPLSGYLLKFFEGGPSQFPSNPGCVGQFTDNGQLVMIGYAFLLYSVVGKFSMRLQRSTSARNTGSFSHDSFSNHAPLHVFWYSPILVFEAEPFDQDILSRWNILLCRPCPCVEKLARPVYSATHTLQLCLLQMALWPYSFRSVAYSFTPKTCLN